MSGPDASRIDGRPLRVLLANRADAGGGAEVVAVNLLRGLRAEGVDAWMAVADRLGDDPGVVVVPRLLPYAASLERWAERHGGGAAASAARFLARPRGSILRRLGREDHRWPASRRLLEMTPDPPDVVHLHNLHGDWFDLRWLPSLSSRIPVVVSLHDDWLLTGHCGSAMGCERWRTGCGRCPDLARPIAIRRDGTAANWRAKARALGAARLHVCVPSGWMRERVRDSLLASAAVEVRVVPYGVDLERFRPGDLRAARSALGLAPEATVLAFNAINARANAAKDFATVAAAAEALAADGRDVVLLVIGDAGAVEHRGRLQIRYAGRMAPEAVACHLQASDLLLHAAHSDTFPMAVIEALACGRPVVATAVGGIVDQVIPLGGADDRSTGALVPARDAAAMAAAVRRILDDRPLAGRLARNARSDAERRFSLSEQIRQHVAWYRTLAGAP